MLLHHPRRFHMGTEELVIVLALLRRVRVNQFDLPGKRCIVLDLLCEPHDSSKSGFVVVQTKTDLGNVRVVAEKLYQRAGASSS